MHLNESDLSSLLNTEYIRP